MSKATGFFMFVVGAAIGSAATYLYIRDKYERIAREEIASVKETFSRKNIRVDSNEAKTEVTEYATVLHELDYATNTTDAPPKPYIIAPEEFDTLDDYDAISLTYYSDDILADDNDEIVDDVDGTVGVEALNSFGDYEDDSVFVRNDRLKCDFEILLVQERYNSRFE